MILDEDADNCVVAASRAASIFTATHFKPWNSGIEEKPGRCLEPFRHLAISAYGLKAKTPYEPRYINKRDVNNAHRGYGLAYRDLRRLSIVAASDKSSRCNCCDVCG
jgi:hypothetical protein